MKKYSWIVALLMALTFATIFIACGVDPIEPEVVAEEFEEVELSNFNAHGGNRKAQQGWGTDGLVFFDDGDGGNKMFAVKNIGVTVEQFQAAKFLQFDVNESKLSASGLDLIWAGVPDQGWNQINITTGAGGTSTGVTRDGGTIKIELARIMANYTKFATYAPSEPGDGLRVIIQYGSLDHADLGITNAKLLIPATPPPFVSVTKIDAATKALPLIVGAADLAGNSYPAVQSLTLVPVITTDSDDPEDLPTVKTVIWSIVSDTTKTTATGAKFVEIPNGSKTVTDKEQWPWVNNQETVTMSGNYADRITATASGNIVVRAIVEDGIMVKESDVGKDLQTVALTATHDSVFEGSDETTGKEGFVTAADVGKTYDFVSKEITIVASGFALKETITGNLSGNAATYYTAADWNYFDEDYTGAGANADGSKGLKGELSTAKGGVIAAYKTGATADPTAEVWIHLKCEQGNHSGWGNGTLFGVDTNGIGYLTTTGTGASAGTTYGIYRLPIADVEAASNTYWTINCWGGLNIQCIQVWANQ